MKRILSAVLVLCVILCSFSACTNSDTGYKPGVIEDKQYANEYLNLGYTLPEGHSFSDEAARQAFADGIIKTMKEADEKVKKNAVICEMISENEDKSERVIITLETKSDEQMATTKEVLQEATYDELYAQYAKLYETYLMLDVPETEMNLGAMFAHDVVATTKDSSTGYVVRRVMTFDANEYYMSVTIACESNERMVDLTHSFKRLVEASTEAAN